MKRIFLLIVTNIAVMVVLSITASLLGADRFLAQSGLNVTMLAVFAGIMGFGGAFISLLISKPMAEVDHRRARDRESANGDEQWLVSTVRRLAIARDRNGRRSRSTKASPTPSPRAPSDSALVAVSTGLLQVDDAGGKWKRSSGTRSGHVANGDMVTLTHIPGWASLTRSSCSFSVVSWAT
jgi:heat shock protein HtpX